MANVGRSEKTPGLEFYRHLLLWHALSGSLHAVYFSFPRRQVVVLFPIILPFYPGPHNRPNLCFQFCQCCLSSELERRRGHALSFHTGSLIALRGGRRGRRSKREDLPPSCRLQTLTHTPTPHSPAFVTCLLVENINTLAGNQSLRVLAKAACPPHPPLSQGHLCEAKSVMETVQRREEGGREGRGL